MKPEDTARILQAAYNLRKIEMISKAPVVELTNGIRVANFSSPHPFRFVDGTVLPRCEPDRVKAGALRVDEERTDGIKGTTDVSLTFHMTESVFMMLRDLEKDPEVDIYLVPLPVMQAIKLFGPHSGRCFWKARVIRVADRETKEIEIDVFCK